jgi:hypothetical protein
MMYSRSLTLAALVAASLSFGAIRANAQILLNGSFETPTVPSAGGFDSATDWNASGPGALYVQSNNAGAATNNTGTTPYGSQFAILEVGSLTQTISGFTAGNTYVLGVDFADEANNGGTFDLSVSGAANASASFTLNPGGNYGSNPIPFQSDVLIFTATSSGTATISLGNITMVSGEPVALDNVGLYGYGPQVTTPEPATWAEMALGCALLAGLAMFRRRSSLGLAS